ncbi:Angio-associated migratory cell protein [Histomonas meleagridis]|uniref:Angio-associated migratory cell protein n=1 Tax=Histomonas meleagridis TaxID=135588 RepID=UPI0035594D4D|nr:Angio-associated migratory cell protein [Histomonas meleagridis]KAH0801620.1 Angio-associated migratory cell protein [Histomonas meleagridis]
MADSAQTPNENNEEIYQENENCDVVIDGNPEEEEMPDDSAITFFHQDAAYCVAFRTQPLPKLQKYTGGVAFASGGGDDKAVLYHLYTGGDISTFELLGHEDSINVIKFSHNGGVVATGDLKGVIILWNALNGQKYKKLVGPGEDESIEWISFCPTAPTLIAGVSSGLIWMWNLKTGNCTNVFSQHNGSVTCGGFSPDGKEIWSAGEDQVLKIWSVGSGCPTSQTKGLQFHHEPIISGCLSPNGALIATGDISGIVKICRFDGGKILGNMDNGKNSIECIAFSPDNKWVATASMGCAATVWNPIDFQLRHALQHPGGVTTLKWHPKRPYIVTGCTDGSIRVWDARNGHLLKEMSGHRNVITAIDVRAVDGSDGDLMIISSSEDTSVKVWSFEEAEIKRNATETFIEE